MAGSSEDSGLSWSILSSGLIALRLAMKAVAISTDIRHMQVSLRWSWYGHGSMKLKWTENQRRMEIEPKINKFDYFGQNLPGLRGVHNHFRVPRYAINSIEGRERVKTFFQVADT